MPHHEGRNKGIAFVQFISLQHAEAARQAMDGKCLSGRLLHVIPSSSRLSDSTSQTGKAETPHSEAFTLRKKSKLLKQADHSFNWAALYMGVSIISQANQPSVGC